MAEQDAAPSADAHDAAPAAAAAPAEPRAFDDVFGKDDQRSFDDVFGPEEEPTASANPIPNVFGATPLGGMVGAINFAIPKTREEQAAYMDNAPAGRIMSAFGDAFRGPGLTQEAIDGAQKYGLAKDWLDDSQDRTNGVVNGILRPIVNGVKDFNQALIEAALGIPEYGFVRPLMGVAGAVSEFGQQQAGSKVAQALRLPLLAEDIAGMLERKATTGEIGEGMPHPRLPEPVAKARATNTIGQGESGYFGLGPFSDVEMDERDAAIARRNAAAQAAAQADIPPEVAPAKVTEWAQQRLDALNEAANGTPDVTTAAEDGKQGVLLNTPGRILTEAERAERDFLKANAADPAAILKGYPNLAFHLAERDGGPQPGVSVETPEAPAAGGEVSAQNPPDIHDVARQIDPVLFKEHDELVARYENFDRWIKELGEVRDREATSQPEVVALDQQIAELQAKADKGGARRARTVIQPQIEALQAQRQEAIDAALSRDSGSMAVVRQDLVATRERLWDLGERVSAAYREAEARMPKPAVPEAVPVGEPEPAATQARAAQTAATESPGQSGAGVEVEPGVSRETGGYQGPATPEELQFIADDVAKQLTAGGYPEEWARNSAQIVAAYYDTRAQRFGGRLGSAREAYQRDAARIRFEDARERELAQGGDLEQAAFHGSPFIFDRFTLDHIGKGEGAQAYGHGLYFAGNKAVAAYYRQKLSGVPEYREVKINGTSERDIYNGSYPLRGEMTEGELRRALGDVVYYARLFKDPEKGLAEAKRLANAMADTDPDKALVKKLFEVARVEVTQDKIPGRLYHVELAPEEGDWLDWDKPLSEQSPKVKAGLQRLQDEHKFLDDGVESNTTGADAYQMLGEKLGETSEPAGNGWTGFRQTLNDRAQNQRAASEALHAAGVPGIRYLDQISRAKGEGSHNFVVFDPGDIVIREFEQRGGGTANGRINVRPGRLGGRPNVITMLRTADASTFMHETAHDWLEQLLRDALHPDAPDDLKADAATVRKWLGAETGHPKRAAHERFARGVERYLMEGRAPSKALAGVFQKFSQWLTAIYRTVSKLRSPINDDIRAVFDRLLAKEPERVTIAPDREPAPSAGDRHEIAAEGAGADGERVGDRIHAEAAADVRANRPELVNETRLEPPGETGTGAPQRPGPDGGGAPTQPVPGAAGPLSGSGAVLPGGGQSAPQGPAAPNPLRMKVPREPMRLASFLKKNGGLRGDRGDVRAIIGGQKGRPGLLNDRTGMAIDDAAQLAWDKGYFPEFSSRPSIDDLLKALENDIKVSPRYSDHDADAVAEYQHAIDYNAEINRLTQELGISLKGLTPAQFWDKVAERMSEEQTAKYAEGKDAEAARVLEDGERHAREWEESRGDAWEPEVTFVNPRSLEDLERDRQQEEAAGNARPIEGGAQRPGSPAADQGQVQEGVRPGESGARPAGRGGAEEGAGGAEPQPAGGAGAGGERGADGQATGEPRGPAVSPDDADLVDKAGNIRLDNLNEPEDVDAALRQIARENDDFKEDRFGSAGRQLHDQILAARQLTAQAMREMAAARDKAARPDSTVEDLRAYQEASNRLTMVARRLATITHDWGFAGQAFRMLKGLPDNQTSVTMYQLARRTEGMTLNQLRQEAQLGMRFDTPEQQIKFLSDVRRSLWEKGRPMIIELFVNNLISGPITHFAYTVGNWSKNIFSQVVETPIAAAVSAIRGRSAGDRIYVGEAGGLLYAHTKGAVDGWSAAAKAWKSGLSEFLPGELEAMTPAERARIAERLPNTGAIPGLAGRVIRLPSNGVAALHSFGRGMFAAQELWRLAYRSASDAGLEGADFDRHMAEFIANPTADVLAQVNEAATRAVLMQRSEYGTAFWHLKQLTEKNIVAKLIAPFMQIGANLLHEGFIERTPLGLINKTVRDNLSGRNGAVAQDMQTGKMIAGITLSTAVVGLTANGILSGGGPSAPAERRVLMTTGWQPYSLKVGERWVPYRKYMGALGPLVAGVADMAEIGQNRSHEDLVHLAASAVGGLAEVIADESWFRGVSNFINAARNYDKPEAERYLRDFITDFIPFSVGGSQIARLVDPYSRQFNTLLDAAKSHVPGLSQSLMPRRDIFGEPIPGRLMTSPSAVVNDPVAQALLDAEYYPSTPRRQINGVDLTDQQYDDFSRIAGRFAKMEMQALVSEPTWASRPQQARQDLIKSVFDAARNRARATVMMAAVGSGNDIMAKSVAAKVAKHGGR